MELETGLGERFFLVTQNVDGLHRRAGHSPGRVAAVHGDIELLRCDHHSPPRLWPHLAELPLEDPFVGGDPDFLRCTECGALARPHVLWFDECYNEHQYRASSVEAFAKEADAVLVVGTALETAMAASFVQDSLRKGLLVVECNLEQVIK